MVRHGFFSSYLYVAIISLLPFMNPPIMASVNESAADQASPDHTVSDEEYVFETIPVADFRIRSCPELEGEASKVLPTVLQIRHWIGIVATFGKYLQFIDTPHTERTKDWLGRIMSAAFGSLDIIEDDEDYANIIANAHDDFFSRNRHISPIEVSQDELPLRDFQSIMACLLNKRVELQLSVSYSPRETRLAPVVDITTYENRHSLGMCPLERRRVADQLRDFEIALTGYLSAQLSEPELA